MLSWKRRVTADSDTPAVAMKLQLVRQKERLRLSLRPPRKSHYIMRLMPRHSENETRQVKVRELRMRIRIMSASASASAPTGSALALPLLLLCGRLHLRVHRRRSCTRPALSSSAAVPVLG